MKKINYTVKELADCKCSMEEAAELYAVAVPLIDGTAAGRELAKVGLDKLAALLQDVYGTLFCRFQATQNNGDKKPVYTLTSTYAQKKKGRKQRR